MLLAFLFAGGLAGLTVAAASRPVAPPQVVLRAGEGGYHTYRIPATVATADGTVVLLVEGRKDSRSDFASIDLLSLRSTDGGATWSTPLVVATEGRIEEQISMGNPAPVYDAIRNRLWCAFTRENQRVFVTFSDDAARTWQRPREITSAVRPPQWTRYWTGPGHGLQLRHRSRHGRLVVPSYHLELESPDGGATSVIVMRSHMLLSDDHGDTWRIGGSTRLAPELAGATARRLAGKWIPGEAAWEGGECMVEELEDGRLYLIVRDQARHDGRKAFAWSHDGGETWAPLALQPQLPDPGCQSSLLRFRSQGAEARELFVSTGITRDDRVAVAAGGDGATSTPVAAPGKGRQRLAVFVSDDGCRSWREAGVIHAGPAAYSDLVPLRDGSVLCLYEAGEDGAYETIRLHRLETRSLRR